MSYYNYSNSSSKSLNLTFYEITAYKILLVFESAAIPVIVCGNLLIVTAVVRFKTLRNASNMMIAFLAFSDLMMGGVYLPMKIVRGTHREMFSERIPCIVNVFFSLFCISNAMNFLALISIERFYAVQFPFHYHSYMTLSRSLVWCASALSISLLVALPSVCGVDTWKPGKPCFALNVMPSSYVSSGIVIIFMISLMGFLAFLRVVVAEFRFRMKDSIQSEARKHDSAKSTLILTVYFFSIACWIPQLIYTIISVFRPQRASEVAIRSVSLLGICSSGVNCFIYGIKNSKFKQAFKKIFRFKNSRVDVVNASSTVQTEIQTEF